MSILKEIEKESETNTMIWLVAGIFLYVMVSIMIVTLFASAKGEDKLRLTSHQHNRG
jgi:hypothetical protein